MKMYFFDSIPRVGLRTPDYHRMGPLDMSAAAPQKREVLQHGPRNGLEEALIRQYLFRTGQIEEAEKLNPGLYISGGGAAAALAAGEVKGIAEKGLLNGQGFGFAVGNSAGALIMLYGALGKTDGTEIFKPDHHIIRLLNIIQKGGLIDYKKLEQMLREGQYALTHEDIARLREFPIPLYAGVMIAQGEGKGSIVFKDLRTEKDPIKTVIASMRLPVGNIGNIELDGVLYADGGLYSPIPYAEFAQFYPTSMTLLLNNPFEIYTSRRIGKNLRERLIQSVRNPVWGGVFGTGSRRNNAISSITHSWQDPNSIPYTVFAPNTPMPGPLKGTFNNNPACLEATIATGHDGMTQILDRILNFDNDQPS